MKYAKILPKGVVTSENFFDGAKPCDDQTPQAPDGMMAIPDGWEETNDEIIRLWKFIPTDPTDSEILDILLGGEDE